MLLLVPLQDALNTSDSAWLTLATEGDTHVLSLLLWDWLDQLKVCNQLEPVWAVFTGPAQGM